MEILKSIFDAVTLERLPTLIFVAVCIWLVWFAEVYCVRGKKDKPSNKNSSSITKPGKTQTTTTTSQTTTTTTNSEEQS